MSETQFEALVKKTITALGNPAAVAKFKAATWKGKGVLYEGDQRSFLTAEWAIQLPFQNRVEGRIVQGDSVLHAISMMNANAGWEIFNGETTAMDEKKLAENQGQFYVNWVLPMTPLDDESFQLDYLGELLLDEHAVFGINVRRKGPDFSFVELQQRNRGEVKLYFDQATGRLAKSEAQIVDEGQEILQETFYHHFQNIEGLIRPLDIEIWRDGKRFADLKLSDYQPRLFMLSSSIMAWRN